MCDLWRSHHCLVKVRAIVIISQPQDGCVVILCDDCANEFLLVRIISISIVVFVT